MPSPPRIQQPAAQLLGGLIKEFGLIPHRSTRGPLPRNLGAFCGQIAPMVSVLPVVPVRKYCAVYYLAHYSYYGMEEVIGSIPIRSTKSTSIEALKASASRIAGKDICSIPIRSTDFLPFREILISQFRRPFDFLSLTQLACCGDRGLTANIQSGSTPKQICDAKGLHSTIECCRHRE